MLEHGGDIHTAAQHYDIPLSDWLDLSTGINPHAWPVEKVSAVSWQRLPPRDDGLQKAACVYYGANQCLPVAGIQAAIQALPVLRTPCEVGVLIPSYSEHAHAWQRGGHCVQFFEPADIQSVIGNLDVLIIVNPNNPTGQVFDKEQLLEWQATLSTKGGWLIVDEAFIDATPDNSLALYTTLPGLIVLRSLGKFFGLAGARCGFVLAEQVLLDRLEVCLGPWAVNGPTREIAQKALADVTWQTHMRKLLQQDSLRLERLLIQYGFISSGATALFHWMRHSQATHFHEVLAKHGILTRYFAEPQSLRIGLPGSEGDWLRLELALQAMSLDEQSESPEEYELAEYAD